MTTKTEGIITILAKELQRPREVIIEESLRALVERQLVQIKADILQIAGKHGISSVEERERQYREGTLEEADSWQDFQRLDHLDTAAIHPLPRLHALPATLPLEGAVRIELEEGIPVFRASDSVQARIEGLLLQEQEAGLAIEEGEELDRYEEIDD